VKAREDTMTGTIMTVKHDKAFGFILAEGQEYFFHRSEVTSGSLEDLKDGDTVEFDVGESPKGPRAERIRKK
jgi:cold shock protein